jgi:SSS family solute:Na+ symporter
MFLAVKFDWINPAAISLSTVSSDMAVNFWRAWWAWTICFGATVLISLSTKPKPDEELAGLVIGLTPDPSRSGDPLVKKPEFYAVVSLVVLIILNIYFW